MRKTFRPTSGGFTLVELVLVMMVMAIILAIAAPRLEGFAHGRNVGEEARQIVALTRLGRSEAIGRGERMEVWLNAKNGGYGLRPQVASSEDSVRKLPTYALARDLSFRFDGAVKYDSWGNVIVRFLPNGTIDSDSPARFTLMENDKPVRTFDQDEYGVRYEATDLTRD